MLKIVVVDDAVSLRKRLIKLLSDTKHICVIGEAGDGTEALKMIKTAKPDVVILDINMGEISGMDVLRKVLHSGRKTRVIMLSSFVTPHIRKLCLQAGAEAVFDKSTQLDELLDYLGMLEAEERV